MARVIPFKNRRGLPGKPVDPVVTADWLARLRKRQTEQMEANRKKDLQATERAEDIRDKPLKK